MQGPDGVITTFRHRVAGDQPIPQFSGPRPNPAGLLLARPLMFSLHRTYLVVALSLLVSGCGFQHVPATPSSRPASPAPRVLGVPVPGSAALVIPVAGVPSQLLRDSYNEPRPGGRTHHAIDIMAPPRTPVLSAADGTVLKMHKSNAGGTSLYVLDHDGQTRYYYAHLDSYAAGLAEGQTVFQGQVIGYVGDTGNAGRGNYHLHFSIALLSDPSRWWEGRNLNPYPLLTGEERRAAR